MVKTEDIASTFRNLPFFHQGAAMAVYEDKGAKCGLAFLPGAQVNVPILADAVANFECRLVTEYRPGNCPLVVGEVLASHVNTDASLPRLMNLGKGDQLKQEKKLMLRTSPTCLFTGTNLSEKTKIEHTILRALGGRIRSRRVTSDTFNEQSSQFDKFFGDQYKLIMHAIAPILPKEFNPGELPITLKNGWKAIRYNGVTSLKGMEIVNRYPSGKPRLCCFTDDEATIKRIAKKQNLKFDHDSMKKGPMPGTIGYHKDMPLHGASTEVSAIKCVLCSFDEICQARYPDFIFTRSPSLAGVRSFISESILAKSNAINIELLDKFYLGVQPDKSPAIEKAINYLGYKRGPYEHIILISSNSATKTIDVLWDLLGIEIHGIRLASSWNESSFCGMIANPILPGKNYTGVIKLNEENPFLSIDRTPYKGFYYGPKALAPQKGMPYILAEQKRQAYYEAVAYIENNATDFQEKQFLYYANESMDKNASVADLIIGRLTRFYENSYSRQEFDNLLKQESQKLIKWQAIPVKSLNSFSKKEWTDFIKAYRESFNALKQPFHDPSRIFISNIDIQESPFTPITKK